VIAQVTYLPATAHRSPISQFYIFISTSLKNKPGFHPDNTATTQTNHDAPPTPQPQRPPLEPGSDISTTGFEILPSIHNGTHALVANKFCMARPHLLLMTADGFARQWAALDRSDLAACWEVLHGLSSSSSPSPSPRSTEVKGICSSAIGTDDWVIFYNCGEAGGCSRLHKHMQVLACPTGVLPPNPPTGDEVPFWVFSKERGTTRGDEGVDGVADELTAAYDDMLEKATGVSPFDDVSGPETKGHAVPHNMILTRRWMAVLPRSRASVNGAETNALGMLGFIAVPSRDKCEVWLEQGPMDVLEKLFVAKS
jgi:ATP adenylyltransferase/5',5'''-P-1,P-4-tetraphosphate phosphorylase II